MLILQQAIAHLKWQYRVHEVVQRFRSNQISRLLATDPMTGHGHKITKNGGKAACIWLVRRIPWIPDDVEGRCAIVNQDQVRELWDYVAADRSMPRGDLAGWSLRRR
jgi:hypothetical protein